MPSPEAIAIGAGGAAGGAFLGAIAKALVDRWARRGFDAVDGYPELAKNVASLKETTGQLMKAVETLARRCDVAESGAAAAIRERDEARRESSELRAQVASLRADTARLEAHVEALQEAVARSADRTEESLQRLLDLVARNPAAVRSAR